jgi:hypothetical protein
MNTPFDQEADPNAPKELHATIVRQHQEAKQHRKKVIFLMALILAVALLTLYFQIRPYHLNSNLDAPQIRSPATDFPHSE